MIPAGLASNWDAATITFAVVQLLLKVTAVLGLALALDVLLMRRALVLARAAMWNSVLILLAVLPLACLLLPSERFLVQPAKPELESVLPAVAMELAPSSATVPTTSAPITTSLPTAPNAEPGNDPQMALTAALPSEPWAEPVRQPAANPWIPTALVVVYLGGCTLMLARLLVGLVQVARLQRSAQAVSDESWRQAIAHWLDRLPAAGHVALRQSANVRVPVVLGHWRPMILLPQEMATARSRRSCDAILIHELAHVVRRDFAWQLLERVLAAVLWFHPLVWLAQRRISLVRERVCDEFAIHHLDGAELYMATLLDMASRLSRRSSLSLGLAVLRSSHLAQRLQAMVDSRGSAACQLARVPRLALLVGAVAMAAWFGRSAIGEPIELPQTEALPTEAQGLLREFEQESEALRAVAERQIAAKSAELESQLKSLQSQYTRADDLDAAVAIRDQIRLLKAAGSADLHISDDPGTMSAYREAVGKSFYFQVVGTMTGPLWGDHIYTHDSSVATAAVHAGALYPGEVGIVKVTMLPGIPNYAQATAGGIASNSWQNDNGFYASFQVERASPEIEALAGIAASRHEARQRRLLSPPRSETRAHAATPQRVTITHPLPSEFIPQGTFVGSLIPVSEPLRDQSPAPPHSIGVRFLMAESNYREFKQLLRSGKVKDAGTLTVFDSNNAPATATFDHFDNEFDPNTGTIGAYGILANDDDLLLPGMSRNVLVKLGPPRPVLTVPKQASQPSDEQGNNYVWLVDPQDILRQQRVRTVGMDKHNLAWLIEEGLSPSDRVVVVKQYQSLRSGERVVPEAAADEKKSGQDPK